MAEAVTPLSVVDEVQRKKSAQDQKYGANVGMGSFTVSNMAYKKISAKRKRKGIAEPVPRQNNMYA